MTLDTSDAAVVRVLRHALTGHTLEIFDMDVGHNVLTPLGAEAGALATALASRPPLPRIEAEDVAWIARQHASPRRVEMKDRLSALRLLALAEAAYARQEQ